jgi:C1A family cysteine protease
MAKKTAKVSGGGKCGFGWLPDLPDFRDHLYAAPLTALRALKPKVDLRPKCPRKILDQGNLGSCTANAIATAIEFDRKKQKLKVFTPSRLFIYYNERVMINTVNSDSGAYIRDGIKSVSKKGACPETTWPYDIEQFTVKPPPAAYKEARKYKVLSYQRLAQNLQQMKGCIASGFPFVFGFTVYDSFMTNAVAANGKVPMPGPSESVQGGHAVLAVGYDDTTQEFICRNSWSAGWGDKGYFYMPYAYLSNNSYADDFWTIRLV